MRAPTCRVLVPVFLLLPLGGLEAQEFPSGRAMVQAISKIVAQGHRITGISSFGWNDRVCMLGALVRPGKAVSFILPLRGRTRYLFIGAGDDDAEDVDIKITDPAGKVVAEDRETDDRPLVSYRPSVAGDYTVTVQLYRATVYCAVALAVLTDSTKGYTVPLQNVVTALRKNLSQAESASILGKVRYHDYENQWALFGQVLPQNASMIVSNMTMEAGRHLFVAAGDESAGDLDLFVRRNAVELGSDVDLDAIPVLLQRTLAGGGYQIEVKNVRSSAAALVLASILE